MAHNETSHKITHLFSVTVSLDIEEDEDRRYLADCSELAGCSVHASSEVEALNKIKTAVDIWIDHANRSIDDDFDIEDFLRDG